jgi:hypothetical protein
MGAGQFNNDRSLYALTKVILAGKQGISTASRTGLAWKTFH